MPGHKQEEYGLVLITLFVVLLLAAAILFGCGFVCVA